MHEVRLSIMAHIAVRDLEQSNSAEQHKSAHSKQHYVQHLVDSLSSVLLYCVHNPLQHW